MFLHWIRRKRVRDRVTVIRGRLFRTAFAWCHNRDLAEDLAQEAAVKAIEKASQVKDLAAIDAWIFSILANAHRAHLRKHSRLEELDDNGQTLVSSDPLPEQVSASSQLVEQVKQAIASLSEDQRKVITLVDIEAFSYTEVASILDIPIGTVMSRLSRARQQLRIKLLAGEGRDRSAVTYLRPGN